MIIMVFGKTQDPISEGRKGALKKSDLRNDKISEAMKNKWTNDVEFRNKGLKHLQNINKLRTREDYSLMGKKSNIREKIAESKLDGLIFRPSDVCDRLCINDTELNVIEIKSKSDKSLKPKQRAFKNALQKVISVKYTVVLED